jgi:hypothetical protein
MLPKHSFLFFFPSSHSDILSLFSLQMRLANSETSVAMCRAAITTAQVDGLRLEKEISELHTRRLANERKKKRVEDELSKQEDRVQQVGSITLGSVLSIITCLAVAIKHSHFIRRLVPYRTR